MKKSAKNSPPTAPAATPAFAWETIYAMQATRQVEALLRELLAAAAGRRARLVYQAGTLFEQVLCRNGQLNRESIDFFQFGDMCQGFACRRSGRQLVFTDCDEFLRVQLELAAAAGRDADVQALARFVFNQLRLLLRIRQYEVDAVKDDLTSAYNQNFLKKFIRDEIARYRRSPAPFAVLFIDLDNLKEINERFCHLIGSQVLKEVAAIFLATVRKSDLVARFGGDEFVVVLLHTGLEQALAVSRRIRQTLNAAVLCRDDKLDIRITASFGITAMSPRVQTAEDIIREADQAMFQVKNSGKNDIRIFQGE